MKTIHQLGLAALLTLATGCSDLVKGTNIVKRNENAREPTGYVCSIESDPHKFPFTRAVDTNGDGHFDEAFVTKGYYLGPGLAQYDSDNGIARATTHYVAPGIAPDQQLYTGFPDTKPLSPRYQAALQLVCNGQ